MMARPRVEGLVLKSESAEVDRIREAYAQRQKCTQGPYSFLNPSFVLLVQERENALLSMLSRYEMGSLEAK